MNANQSLGFPVQGSVSALPATPHAGPAETNLFRVVHRLLRGRYAFAIVLIPLCALLGGAVGYSQGSQAYQSTGVVRVRPVLPRIIYETEQNDLPPMFTSYVSTQARLFTTERVLLRALEDEVLKRAYGEDGVPSHEVFAKNLRVSTERNAPELIFVSYRSAKPGVSHAAVGAVIRAYVDLFGSEGSLRQPETLGILADRRRELESSIRSQRAQIAQLGSEWGTTDLSFVQEAEFSKIAASRDEIARLRSQLRAVEAELAGGATEIPVQPDAPVEDIITALGQEDEQIALLGATWRTMVTERQRALAAGGRPEHRQVLSLTEGIARFEEQIRERVAQLAPSYGDRARRSLERRRDLLTAELETATSAADAAKAEAARIGAARVQIERLTDEIAATQRDLSEVERRITAIQTESKVEDFVSGRISVVSSGSQPTLPSEDSRKRNAALGLVAGGGLPFAALLALGLLDRRVRYADDVEPDDEPTPRLLAVVPRIDPGQKGLPEGEIARIIHGLRGRLQIGLGSGAPSAIAITSAAPGEGKTTLSVSLAMSFADTGARVIALDFDFVGRGLSAQLGLDGSRSLVDLVAERRPDEAILPTRFPNIRAVLPTPDDASKLGRLSPENVRRFIADLRDRADVVIIDTGPILGSLESVLSCAAADGAVLVVGRGTSRATVQAARTQLKDLKAELLGVVFNGATVADALRSGSSSRSLSAPPSPGRSASLGPVASSLSA